MRTLFLFILVSLASANLPGCADGPGNKAGDDRADEALASVDGNPVPRSRFEAYLKFKRASETDEARRQALLEEYLEREALAAAIEKQSLLDKELTEAELNEFRKEMLIGRYFEKFLDEKATDEAVENYYKTHPAEFERREIHAAHILIRTNPAMGEVERKAKLTTALEACSRARSGETFSGLAENLSEDRLSGKKGGDLGWIKEGAFDKRFSEAAFALKPGEISEPVETAFGFHVIQNIEGPRTIMNPFDSVSGDIRHRLRNKAKKAEIGRLLEKARIERDGSGGAVRR